MKTVVTAALAGVIFAIGLVLSGMTIPAKVVGFLDVTGAWDPTLAFVMGGAIAVHLPFVRLAKQRAAPLFAPAFHWPQATRIDALLVGGAALFGVGWGLSGYCPGPALVSVTAGGMPALAFVAAMTVGLVGTTMLVRR